MEMTADQRADLATRVTEARFQRFKGSRLAAYREAEVNSGTWTRLEAALPVAERTVVAVVQMLWPETGGDWRKLDPPLGSSSDIETQVRASNLSASTKDYVLNLLAEKRGTA